MLLDIEVAARPGISIHQARRNLDAFQDAAAGFLHTSQRVDVLAFLAWLEAAAAEENGLDAAAPEVNHEAVQLLTVHASKGLEWDVVFVPGLNAGAFPSSRRLAVEQRQCGPALAAARGSHRPAPMGPGPAGPERLARRREGVQVRRPGARRSRGTAPGLRGLHPGQTRALDFQCRMGGIPGRVWQRCRLPCGLEGLAAEGAAEIHPLSVSRGSLPAESPLTSELEVAVWPYIRCEGPLTPGRERLGLSRPPGGHGIRCGPGPRQAWMPARSLPGPGRPQRPPRMTTGHRRPHLRGPAAGWAREAATLLERRSRRSCPGRALARPHFRVHPRGPGRRRGSVVARLRRPVPREPGMSARKGTAFHAWVEEYFGAAGMLDLGEAAGRTTTSTRPTAWTPWWKPSAGPSGPTAPPPMSRSRWRHGSATSWSAAGSTPSSGTPTAAGTSWTGRPGAAPRPAS